MDNDRKKEINRKAVQKYRAKTVSFALKYNAPDKIEGLRLQSYLAQSGQSANAYLKSLVKADLDSKGIAYPDPEEDDRI